MSSAVSRMCPSSARSSSALLAPGRESELGVEGVEAEDVVVAPVAAWGQGPR